VTRQLLLGCLLLVGGPLAAQSAEGRWSLQIRSETGADRGDLRIDSLDARVLLESNDRRWVPLSGYRNDAQRIIFRTGASRRFEGTVEADVMSGRVFDADREVATWEARRIQPGTDRWPVRPRLTVRQLVTGTGDTLAHFPLPWYNRILSRDALLAEHATLARDAGFAPAVVSEIAARAQRTMLGFDADARRAAQVLLERIATTPAADDSFRGLFTNPGGGWRLDLHDVAWQLAADAQGHPVDLGGVLRGLGELGVRADSSSVIHAVWQFWGRQRNNPQSPAVLNATLARDSATGQRLAPLLSGYDSATHWWLRAVQWLMTAHWVETPDGWRSPTDLMRTFWDGDSLALPVIEPHHFGGLQAVPVIGAGQIAVLLLRPDNAIAEEWLRDQEHRDQALETWRRLDFADPVPLRVAFGDRTMRVTSAARVAQSRLGGFLASRDAIRIDAAIMPVFAVGTVVHEWHHLLFEAARMAEEGTQAFHDGPGGVTLVEADPWLGEGAAEWATEAVLQPVRATTPLLTLVEMEKRLSIGAGVPDDTHVLGYLLVRAAVNRTAASAELRKLLVRHLHDPAAFAAALGLDSNETHGIPRPSTLMVIPEVTFTYDGGVADHATRRLVVPALPTEY
jgi:hypothetical protein